MKKYNNWKTYEFVICINNEGFEKHLTINREYQILSKTEVKLFEIENIHITDDNGNLFNCRCSRFITYKEMIKQKLIIIGSV